MDNEDHFFCCSDCADTFDRNLSTETATVLRARIGPGEVVADLGCGSGHYSVLLAELVGEDGLVYAADTSPERVNQALTTLKRRKLAGRVVAQVSSPGRHAFIPEASVDFVLSNNVLCCTNERRAEVREVARVLKPGGVLYARAAGQSPEGVRAIEEDEWTALFQPFRETESGATGTVRWKIVTKP